MSEKIKLYNFKTGLAQEFEIIDFDLLFSDFSEEITKPHRTEFYQILWFENSTPSHLIDFNPIKIKPNTLLFVNKASVQLFNRTSRPRGKIILFTDNFFCKTEADVKFLKSSILFNDLLSLSHIDISKSSQQYERLLQLIQLEIKKPVDSFQADILRNYLHNFLLLAERERRKQDFIEIKKDANLDYALQLMDLLDLHYVAHKQVSFYSEQMNITTKRLNKATSTIFGKTPKNIIDDKVLLEAKRLITHTNFNIKEITYSLGLDEPTNFIKYFKKHTNRTPLEFRTKFFKD